MPAKTDQFPWQRYWHRRGDRPTLADGYLVSPNQKPDWFSASQATTLKTLAQLADVPCLVLLGDPGTGKSTEILNEVSRLAACLPTGTKVKGINLKLRSEAQIEKQVFQRDEFIGWTEGRHALVLLFDSMDECWRRVPELGPVILDELEPHFAKQLPPLYLRLGCRAAEWRDEIEKSLRVVFREKKDGDKVQVWELAPLTQDNVHTAAEVSGLDAEKFLSEVRLREVNAFAAHPITLQMLLATAKQGGQLGRDRFEIYQKGCELLCIDQHQDEKAKPRLSTTVQQRVACASYLATICVLSNRYLIYGSTEQRPADESGTIIAQDLLGQKTLLTGGEAEFTREVLAETLQTGLLDAQTGEMFSWRHQSYAEYLAASYLHRREMPIPEIVQSLCDTSTGVPRLWPQVEETACWLATLATEFFNQLVGANAEVFVRCDPARLAPNQRAKIVDGYLEQVRGHEAQSANGREISRLSRLAHPGLAKQLTPLIEDSTQDVFVRDLAIDIVRACELRELTDVLIKVMLTPDERGRLRHRAGIALREWADANIRAKLKAEMKPEYLDDDDVRGCVLSILWPTAISALEIVPYLTKPKQANYTGFYQIFLFSEFSGGLSQEDLIPLIEWANSVAKDSDLPKHDEFGRARENILLAAYHALENGQIRTAFMAVVKDYAHRYGVLFKLEGRDLSTERGARQLFWRELIANDLPVRNTIIGASLHKSGLVHEDDFDWVMDEVVAASPRDRDRWLELAFYLFQPLRRMEQVARMMPLAEAEAAVAEQMRIYTTSSLVEKNGEPNWQKDEHYRQEKREAERAQRKPFKQQVDEMLTGYESTQKPNFIWGLANRLGYPVMDSDEPGGNNLSDVGWKHLTEEQRARILALAPCFIAAVTVDPSEVYDPAKYYWSYVAGASFLLLLVEADSLWPQAQSAEFWSAWAPVVIHYRERAHHVDNAVWEELLKLVFDKAKPAFLTALGRWFAEESARYFPIERLATLPVGTDRELEDVLITSATTGKRENETEFDLFGFLLGKRSARTEATLVSWQPVPGAPIHEKAHLADALLLCFRPSNCGAQIVDRILADDEWGRNVFSRLAHMNGVPSQWLHAIDPDRLARLWEWLNKAYPEDPFEGEEGGRVTTKHEIRMFRSRLLDFIVKQGTIEAVESIRSLTLRHPDYPWLGQVLADARQILRRESWKPPAARATIAYLAYTGTPPLCNDADLADAVKGSLGRYHELLKGPRPLTELWNEVSGGRKTIWSPKDEENLSDCLARHFERDLKPLNVQVAREAELRQRTGSASGDEPDLIVTAPHAAGNGETLTVVVEVKCSWNPQAVTGMEQQLLNRYLRGLRCGIYVVAHFNCASWSATDRRRSQSLSAKTLAEVSVILESERQRLTAMTSKRLDLLVLDAAV